MFVRQLDLRSRSLAAGVHLLLSLCIAGFAALLVFGLWYPGTYRSLAGGRSLFVLLVVVDVVMGPLLTFAIFNLEKRTIDLRRDLAIVGLLQFAALGYGLHTVYIARPIAMVFEVDRFRLVTADAVNIAELPKAPVAYRELPLSGPWLIGARQPSAGEERNDALFLGVAGVDVSQRPLFWRPYEEVRTRALGRSRPMSALLSRYPEAAVDIRRRLGELALDEGAARWLPTIARGDWIVILDADGNVRGYLPLDGFF